MPKPIFILNGPNLNLLGTREPEVYGSLTLDQIGERAAARAARHGLEVEFRQSNHEGKLADWMQEASREASGAIINAAGLTHTSVVLCDCVRAAGIPCIEVHLSNIFAREPYRRHSYISPAALGVICGLGAIGYELAIEALAEKLQ